ncbi:MAG: DUF4129 domain-containing protein [Chloroflexota bacterium]
MSPPHLLTLSPPLLATLWRHGRHELLYLAWAGMEWSLLAPLALANMPWARYWPPAALFLWLLVITLLPFNLSRLLTALEISLNRQRVITAGGMLLTVLVAWRVLLFEGASPFDLGWLRELVGHLPGDNPFWTRDKAVFLLVAVAWWRGLALLGRKIEVENTGLRFRSLVLFLAPLVIAASSPLPAAALVAFILLFLLTSLLAIAITRAEQVEAEASGQALAMTPRWLIMVAAAGLLVVATAAVLSLTTAGTLMPGLIGRLALFSMALRLMTTTIFSALLYLLSPLLWLFDWWLNWLIVLFGRTFGRGFQQLAERLQESQGEDLTELFQDLVPPPAAAEPNRLAPLLVMAAIIVLITLTLGRWRQRRRAIDEGNQAAGRDQDEASERLAGPSLGRRWLRRLAGRWTAASIRRIYSQLCQAAAANGYPRDEAETPYEYLPVVTRLWPERTADLERITEAYVRTRYGQTPEDADELEQLREAWRRIERTRPAPLLAKT